MKKVGDIFAELPPLEENASQEQRYGRGETAYKVTYQQWNSLGITLGQRYDESPLTIRNNWEAPPYSATEYWHYASPGHLAPHLWLDYGSPLLDHFGKVFTLLDAEASDVLVTRFLGAAERVELPITRLRLPLSVARSKYPASITIIRPDQDISWKGDECDDPVLLHDRIGGER